MSEFLKIGKGGSIFLDGKLVNLSEIGDVKSFLKSSLSYYTEIEDGLTIGDFVHLCYHIGDFIEEYYLEKYETVRAIVNAGTLRSFHEELSVSKSLRLEKIMNYDDGEYLYFFTNAKLMEVINVGTGTNKIKDLPIVLDNRVSVKIGEFKTEVKSKFTFLEIVGAVFDDFADQMQNGVYLA